MLKIGEPMDKVKIQAQKLWMDHNHHAAIFLAGVIVGAIIW